MLEVHHSRLLQTALLVIAATAATYTRSTFGPLQEVARLSLSFSDNQMALLQGLALALPTVVLAIPVGLLIDRYSRVRTLLVCALCNLVASLVTAVASDFAILFMARCAIGLAATTTVIACASLIADLYSPGARGRANMIIAIGQVVGMSLAFGAGGALLSEFGVVGESWRMAIAWLSSPLFAVTLVLLVLSEPARLGRVSARASVKGSLVALWQYRRQIAPLVAGGVLVSVADGAAIIWAAPMMARSYGLTPGEIGGIVAVVLLIAGLLGPVIGGHVVDYCQTHGGPCRTLTVVSVLAVVSAPGGLFGIASSASVSALLLTLLMVVGNMIGVMFTTMFTIIVPNELRGTCLALTSAAGMTFGIGLAPLTVSLLSGYLGGTAAIGPALAIVSVSTCLVAAALFAQGRGSMPGMHPADSGAAV